MGSSSLTGEQHQAGDQMEGFGFTHQLEPGWIYVSLSLSLSLKVEAIAGWMESVAKTLPKRGYEQACGIWNGHDYIPILRQMGITVMTFEIILVSTIPLTVWLVSRGLRLLMWWMVFSLTV